MGKLGGFLAIERRGVPYRDSHERAHDYSEFLVTRPVEELREQGARCMDCGVPFCHNGCPLGNLIPDWNDLVYHDRFRDAIAQLHATNNFPEFTGRLCPAPCEAACVLEIREGDAVTIKQIENAIINRAFQEGWVVPQPPRSETGQAVAVVGSGPAGMAAAQQLRRAGHRVTLFERDEAIGGLVRFGVPDFKIEKSVVERRVEQLAAEGVELRCGVDVGVDVGAEELRAGYDAVVIATGSRVPRDLPAPGRELDGVHFAMDYLYQRNRFVAGEHGPAPRVAAPERGAEITARDKDVVVIGGGDTGADCVGNALREGARSITQLELLSEPPPHRPDDRTPWPLWPLKYRLSYAMEEVRELGVGEQDYSVATTELRDDGNGRVAALVIAEAEPGPPFAPVPGTERELKGQLVLLAMGFLHPEPALLDQLGVQRDARGNVKALSPYTTSVDGVFAAGDARRGQSLIVWAINEGRQCARMVERYLERRRNAGSGLPADDGMAGHADADGGPEGPPQHVSPAIGAAREEDSIAVPAATERDMPTFCRHNRFVERCAICRREADEAAGPRRPAARRAGAATAPRRGGAASRVRSGAAVSVRRELRAEEDGYRTELVPGLRASADAARLAEEIAFSCGRLLVLAAAPPGPYGQAHALASTDPAGASWILFVTAYLCPLEGEEPFIGIESALAQEQPDLSEVPLGPRTSHERARGTRTLHAYRQWLSRAGGAGAFAGDASWTPQRRFERLYERLALPGLTRAARYDLLVSLGRVGVSDLGGGSLHFVQARGESTADATLLAAKRVFGIGDPLLLERRAAALADAAAVPIEALDLALANWGSAERTAMGVSPGTQDAAALDGARAALGV